MSNVRVSGEPIDLAAVVDVLAAARDAEKLPGIVAAVSVGDRVASIAIGYRDIESRVPIDVTDPLRLSSMMKPFTATAVMQLVESGDLTLDQPVAERLTSIDIDPRITVRHLLVHCGGLARPGYFHVAEGDQLPTVSEFYAAGPLECAVEPGSAFEYSNHGYAVLGQLVEDITVTPFADFVTQNILRPLAAPVQFDEGAAPTPGFEFDDDGVLSKAPNYVPMLTPASGGWVSVESLLKLATAVATGGPGLPKGANSARSTSDISPSGIPSRAAGWVLTQRNGRRTLNHAGGWPGYSGNLACCPELGLAAAVMMNMSAESRGELGLRILDALPH
ncbi:MAG: hypothetical protein QOF21_56 [Actinomycetota bacterium]|jgi:CubicO group peptidase (beta-lactamase class C family)